MLEALLELLFTLVCFVFETLITLVLVLTELFALLAIFLLKLLGYSWKAAPVNWGTAHLAAMSPIRRAVCLISSTLLIALLAVFLWHYLR